jgi:hypothetical protein
MASVTAEDRAARECRATGRRRRSPTSPNRVPRDLACRAPRVQFLPCRFDRAPHVVHDARAQRRIRRERESLVRHGVRAQVAQERSRGTAIASIARGVAFAAQPRPLPLTTPSHGEGGTMQRKTSLLATAMLLAIATAAAAQSTDPNTQNQPA